MQHHPLLQAQGVGGTPVHNTPVHNSCLGGKNALNSPPPLIHHHAHFVGTLYWDSPGLWDHTKVQGKRTHLPTPSSQGSCGQGVRMGVSGIFSRSWRAQHCSNVLKCMQCHPPLTPAVIHPTHAMYTRCHGHACDQ